MNFNSNHPYFIKREIPSMIQKRLSSLSKTKEIFEKNIPYESALKNSGFRTSLSNVKDIIKKKQRLKKKRVFCYNPPFSNCVKTDIKKESLKTVSKNLLKSGIY